MSTPANPTERPILMSAPMVRAILAGTKTQTRRAVKKVLPALTLWSFERARPSADGCALEHDCIIDRDHQPSALEFLGSETDLCPYGAAGDRLWVRESFQPLLADGVDWRDADYETGDGYAINYCATGGVAEFHDCANDEAFCSRITPSIFMPRWASRILLEITEVRVQRLNSLSEDDAVAEGIERVGDRFEGYLKLFGSKDYDPALAVTSFSQLWETINGTGSWNSNPWVWALTFKVVKP